MLHAADIIVSWPQIKSSRRSIQLCLWPRSQISGIPALGDSDALQSATQRQVAEMKVTESLFSSLVRLLCRSACTLRCCCAHQTNSLLRRPAGKAKGMRSSVHMLSFVRARCLSLGMQDALGVHTSKACGISLPRVLRKRTRVSSAMKCLCV